MTTSSRKRRTRRPGADSGPLPVIGYARVSTTEQADSGAGLDAQHAAITAEATRRGWTLVDIATDAGASGKSLAGRPALAAALTALDNGEAAALVVAKVDRLSRSLADFAALMQRAERSGWKVVTLDLPIDTTAPAGELMAAVVAATAQYERRLIGVRTRDALAARRAAGVKLGRPRLLDATVAERIRAARLEGATLQAIADELNGEGTLTATGKQWSPALVRKVALQEPVSNAEDAA